MPSPGEALLQAGLAREALSYLLAAHEAEPERWEHLSNLGSAYRIIQELPASMECLERALEINPRASQAWHNLSNTLEDLGQFEKALECARAAFGINPTRVSALSLAFSLLRERQWGEAWPLLEFARLGMSWNPIAGIPTWKGEPIDGKNLLVIREGGYGDTFLYMRYFESLKRQGANISLLVWSKQAGILEEHPWIDQVIDDSKPFDGRKFHFQCPIMSMPFLADATIQGTSPMGRYIEPREDFIDKAATALANGGRKKIGICWQAQESAMPKKFRSMSVYEIAPLQGVDARFISLCPDMVAPDWVEQRPELTQSWEATAGLIDQLDLVVSVDTAVAHLAGALGKPTIIVLPLNSDWKWLRGIDRTIWYESAQVVRNTDPYSFSPAVAELKGILDAYVSRVI